MEALPTVTRGSEEDEAYERREGLLQAKERGEGGEEEDDREPQGPLRLIGMNSFFFAYGCYISSFGIVTLPTESERFFPQYHDLALASFLAIAGLSQLSGPTAGFFSDRYVSRHGRRRPLLAMGALVALPSIFVMWLARSYPAAGWAPTTYFAAFFLAMMALNTMYSSCAGLIPDLVPEAELGKANGIMAAMTALGACMGFLFIFNFPDTAALYKLYVGLMCTTVPLTLVASREKPALAEHPPWEWSEITSSYWIDANAHPDFFYLFLCRMCYYCGVSVQVFVKFWMRDIVVDKDGHSFTTEESAKYTADIGFIIQVFGALGAYPSGLLSDLTGRKPLVAISCFGIIAVYICFCFMDHLGQLLWMGTVYGLWNGMYLSVDYALAVDCLPSKEESARWLAVWSVACFLGTTIGPLVSGPVLFIFSVPPDPDAGPDAPHRTSHNGYRAIMLIGAVWMALSAALLVMIKKGGRPARNQL
mmetsp:Transcript_5746/g.19597  ORF Transcript_5746/g.19597 Transcript_5746/m.19597 type:complete len:476 (-) Transcript_5746:52-1479(-)|eukprot:CAMPEP_0170154798 /NCGR_PEP_ID=MMETSP0033_2-20121228/58887_1 /TAXON_ID=195969 /ORGANISM="Dolichomastix tenuilepis, Strain CCMP3274" /LENGTH=475 /DNA_ID=CAMNT_0010392077 /DNA_START=124 /DNA_END=1551 /DNA_ORIENTATION=-